MIVRTFPDVQLFLKKKGHMSKWWCSWCVKRSRFFINACSAAALHDEDKHTARMASSFTSCSIKPSLFNTSTTGNRSSSRPRRVDQRCFQTRTHRECETQPGSPSNSGGWRPESSQHARNEWYPAWMYTACLGLRSLGSLKSWPLSIFPSTPIRYA